MESTIEISRVSIIHQLYYHVGDYLDFIVYHPEKQSIILKCDTQLLRLDSDTFKVKKRKELNRAHGARSAIISDGKLYVSFKNQTLYVYDAWSLEQLVPGGL
jgi:hypothetical protein